MSRAYDKRPNSRPAIMFAEKPKPFTCVTCGEVIQGVPGQKWCFKQPCQEARTEDFRRRNAKSQKRCAQKKERVKRQKEAGLL
jgi:hypothetical protein